MRRTSLLVLPPLLALSACLVHGTSENRPSPPAATAPGQDAGAPIAPPPDAGARAAAGPAARATPDAGAIALPSGDAGARPITMVVGGDVTVGFHYEEWFDEQVKKGVSRDEMFAWGFAKVKPVVEGADLFVVNLECPFTDRGEKIEKNFNFRARPELVNVLLAGGVGAVSLANNHMMDYGPVGLEDTLATLDQAKIPHFGAGRNLAEARKPAIVERGGIKIAFLGYFFLGDHNIEPPEVIATETTPGVAGHHDDVEVLERMLREDVAQARTQADLVIPFFHWGKEGEHLPQPYQPRLVRAAFEAGAAMVLGSHPHVLQGMELADGKPAVYSLGNFVFGGNWNPKDKESALVRFRLTPGGYQSSEVVPIQTDQFPTVPVQPFPLEGQSAERVLQHLAQYSAGFPKMLPPLDQHVPPPDALPPPAPVKTRSAKRPGAKHTRSVAKR